MKIAELKVEMRGSIVDVHVRGEIDLSNAKELREGVARLTPNHALGVVLDLTDVSYLDSAGIHLVHQLRENLRARGLQLMLVIPSGSPVNHSLRLAGLEWGREVAETAGDAHDALARDQRA